MTETEYRGYRLVPDDDLIEVRAPGRGGLFYVATDMDEATRWIDDFLDGGEAA